MGRRDRPRRTTPSLGDSGQAVEFIKDQYRHCKPILLFDGASALLEKLDLPDPPVNGPVEGDAALLAFQDDSAEEALSAFINVLMKHRNFERETDPRVSKVTIANLTPKVPLE